MNYFSVVVIKYLNKKKVTKQVDYFNFSMGIESILNGKAWHSSRSKKLPGHMFL